MWYIATRWLPCKPVHSIDVVICDIHVSSFNYACTQVVPGVWIYWLQLQVEIHDLKEQIGNITSNYSTLESNYTHLENEHKTLNHTLSILTVQMEQIQYIRKEKNVVQKNIQRMSRYYELQKKNASGGGMLSSKEELTHDEHLEVERLEKHFKRKLPKSYTAIAKTKKATEELLKHFESLETEYQELLIEGDIEKMQSEQGNTKTRIQNMLIEGRALIKAGDENAVSADAIVDLLFQGVSKMIRNMVN